MTLVRQHSIKATLRGLLPSVIYDYGSRLKHKLRWQAQTLNLAARLGLPDILFHFGEAPGDDLLCTVVLREWRARHGSRAWMMSNFPGIFLGNADVERVVPVDPTYERFIRDWNRKYSRLEYAAINYEKDRSIPPDRHIISEMCFRVGIRGGIALRPYLHLSKEEVAQTSWAQGCIAIQSSGLGSKYPMRNKQWYPERFQELVNLLGARFKFVQVGSAEDPPLSKVVDLRGKTDIRVTASVLANCRLFVGNVGFLMHLARAVECPSVIVFGGRESPRQSGYTCNINLYSAVPCAPCWFWNRCDYNRMCMDLITPAQVVEAVEKLIARPRNPLLIDRLIVS